MNWWKSLKGKVKRSEPLNKHTTFRLGGRADFFIEPKDNQDLKLLLNYAKIHKLKLLLIGSGSNILAKDGNIRKIIAHLNSGYFAKIKFENNYCEAGSATVLARLIKAAHARSLAGLEFLTGVPGTVGGALVMNAGAWGKEIADFLTEVKVMDYNGRVRLMKKEEIKFGYRSSSLDKYIILGAKFKLSRDSEKNIGNRIADYLKKRRSSQDNAFPNAGCIFRNPRGTSAGKLIDLCGLKGRCAGGAVISKKHANFILNRKNASAQDVLELVKLIKREVRNKFRINLETEIKIWQ
ncbi:MAG: UDP-N-acetylmuramate dehydrogenase [Candidatus Omnitrophota bacterium]|jgi:UDP-N-acetylmuramate dehydrogenase